MVTTARLEAIVQDYDAVRNWAIREADDTPRVQALTVAFRLELTAYERACQSGQALTPSGYAQESLL